MLFRGEKLSSRERDAVSGGAGACDWSDSSDRSNPFDRSDRKAEAHRASEGRSGFLDYSL